MGNSLHFDGVDLAGYGLTVLDVELGLSAPPRDSAEAMAYRDGSIAGRRAFAAREIGIQALVEGASWSGLETNLDSIAKQFNRRDDAELYFDGHFSDRYWLARLANEAKISRLGIAAARVELVFAVSDPFGYSRTETDHDHTITGADFTTSETAGGTMECWPVWTITAGAGASLVVLENQTRDERLAWENTLASGGVLIIDSRPDRQEVRYDAGGDPEDATRSMANVSGLFPGLSPGANSVRLWGPASGTLNLTYRARYL